MRILLACLAILAVATATPSCNDYCQTWTTQAASVGCVWQNQWATESDCVTWCNTKPLGTATDISENGMDTVGCRQYHLGVALSGAGTEHCGHAGITGGSQCGTYCENYCQTIQNSCAEAFHDLTGTFDMAGCMQICEGIPDTGDAEDPLNDLGNNIQCRIYHAGIPAAADAAVHCPHASPVGGLVCGSDPCEGYCNQIMTTCADEDLNNGAIYFAGIADCMTQCGQLDPTDIGTQYGVIGPTSGNTLGCRAYHGGVPSVVEPEVHCPHASLGGGSVCGDPCDIYCDLAINNCVGANQLYADRTTCMQTCAAFPVSGDYTSTGGDNVECRIYHAGVSLDDPDVHCAHASRLGGGVCTAPPSTACSELCTAYFEAGQLCSAAENGWATQSDCEAWCSTQTDGVNTGPAAAAEDTVNCRLYHLQVANTPGEQMVDAHCGHASVTGGNQCGLYCDVYCRQMAAECPSTYDIGGGFDMAECMTACADIPTTGADHAPASEAADNIQCRIYHGSFPAIASPSVHCPHASQLGGGVCGTPCASYCRMSATNCGADDAALGEIWFGAIADCENQCEGNLVDDSAAAWGTAAVVGGDTLGCRAYHASVPSSLDADVHCPHASLSGGDVCGTPCEIYCRLFEQNCGDRSFAYADSTECMTACSAMATDANGAADYTVTGGDSVQCRIYHAAVSLDDPDVHCAHASENGGGVCGGAPFSSSSVGSSSSSSVVSSSVSSSVSNSVSSSESSQPVGSMSSSASTVVASAILIVIAALF